MKSKCQMAFAAMLAYALGAVLLAAETRPTILTVDELH